MMKINYKLLHPIYFTIFPVLFIFSHNIDELFYSAWNFLPVVLLSLFAGVALFALVVYFVTGRRAIVTSIVTSITLMFFFSYGYIFDYLLGQFGMEVVRHRFLLPLAFGLNVALFLYTVFTKRSLQKLNDFLNFTGLVLVLISGYLIVSFWLTTGFSDSRSLNYYVTDDQLEITNFAIKHPDVYYIVLDGYADSDVLYTFYNYDNTPFLNFLEERGFFMAYDSTTNYGYTYASLGSSLNMQYLEDAVNAIGAETGSLSLFSYMIENNAVLNVFQRLGYHYVHLSSGYPMTNFNHHADSFYREGMDRFSLFLLNSTVLRPFVDPTSSYRIGFNRNDEVRRRINYQFSVLRELPEQQLVSEPRFIFAHLVVPHQPFVFDADGNPVDDRPDDSMEGYLDQLIYTNQEMTKVVDSILQNSDTPPIIIIQSDHGSNPQRADSSTYKFHNFTAIHMGNVSSDSLTVDITPVNIFRSVFNGTFGTNFPLLEQKSYIARENKLDFEEVTNEVEEQRERLRRQ